MDNNTVLKLLVVDDSKMMRDAIRTMFEDDPHIDVVGEAADGISALEAVKKYNPDVITMDVAMPVMDGITTLKHLMIKNPKPVVMLSSLTVVGATVTFDALRYGAVDFISKPSALEGSTIEHQVEDIRSKVRFAAGVEVNAIKYIRRNHPNGQALNAPLTGSCKKVVTFGAAEGGYGSMLKIIPHLQANDNTAYMASIYATPEHVDAFTEYLNSCSSVFVKRAKHGEEIKPGVCYLNVGSDYMTVHKTDMAYSLHINPAPFASRKGAVDMLMFSAADITEENCIGVILSGSGADGSEGLEEVIRMGGQAIVQDPHSCLSKDMALAALERSDVEWVISDSEIADKVNSLVS
ncbi:MAG: response regulator [Gammaproteobacteria bacterium]|nr:response regulator [Gammaproteobacteria bacterium]MDH5800715.1 response regulator [Gammaproteobacteria bacterium]